MSLHINALPEQIAETVFLTGDPLRAKFIADTYLKEVVCYNKVRNMFGFTGLAPNGKRVSVQGTGMGMASLSIYVNELIDFYHVKRLIRLGSAGSLKKELACFEIVLAMAACSDSSMNINRFPVGINFAPTATWKLLEEAYCVSKLKNINVQVGNIFASDKFYDESNPWKVLAEYGVLAIEMETAELYTLGAEKRVEVLTMLTISNNLVTKEELSPEQRETGFGRMFSVALELIL